jgi:CelD/BcsL family acetyltransferase involved in cellulose biosynthesis
LPSGGAFHQVLVDVLHQQRLASRIENRYLRALYRVPASASSYVAEALSGRTRKHVRRQRERLAAMGALDYSTLETTSDPKAWLREFLDLEATGWKGKANTAMASSATHRQFFMEATAEALERRKILGAALRLDGRMIAGRIGFRSSEGSYLFKIAYDEQLAAFSPGTLLELQTIEHGLPEGVEWTDSCTSSTNTTFRSLWLHSRIIEHLVVSPGRTSGDLAIELVPLLRRIGTLMKRTPATAPIEEGNRVKSIE